MRRSIPHQIIILIRAAASNFISTCCRVDRKLRENLLSRKRSPLGTVRTHKTGSAKTPQLFIKVPSNNCSGEKWIRFSRHWWLENRGEIPPGMGIYHRDGNLMNNDPENLAIGTASEIGKSIRRRNAGRPHKKLPLGTIRRYRVRAGQPKTKFIRVAMTGSTSEQWMRYSRFWWISNVGPIPKGYGVFSRDFDPTNDSPDNLVLRTSLEHLRAWEQAFPERATATRQQIARDQQALLLATSYLADGWYAVDMNQKIIYATPLQRRWQILEAWREKGNVVAVRGRRLREAQYRTFRRVDQFRLKPTKMGSGRSGQRWQRPRAA